MKNSAKLYLKEFKNLNKDEFLSIAKKNIKNENYFNITFEDDAYYGYRWKISWNKVDYIDKDGQDCSFCTNFIFVYPFENEFYFMGKISKIDEDLIKYVRTCPHYMDAYFEKYKDINISEIRSDL